MTTGDWFGLAAIACSIIVSLVTVAWKLGGVKVAVTNLSREMTKVFELFGNLPCPVRLERIAKVEERVEGHEQRITRMEQE